MYKIFIRTPANKIIFIIQHNIWKSGIIPVPLTPGQQSAFYDCLKYSEFGILWIKFSDRTVRAHA